MSSLRKFVNSLPTSDWMDGLDWTPNIKVLEANVYRYSNLHVISPLQEEPVLSTKNHNSLETTIKCHVQP